MRAPFEIAGRYVKPGQREFFDLEVGALFDYTKVSIPIEVIHGRDDGPVLFISAAIHGDEINGVEIIKRLRKLKTIDRIKGTLILVPIVNVFGFNAKSRYLPDRRDLNRSFPGSMKGSSAARIAHIFMQEVVSRAEYGIDLHTGATDRINFPQVRADLEDPSTLEIINAFGASVVINSRLRDGSLREAARKEGVKMLLFEGGEALRFDEFAIRQGLKGCLGVMRQVGMMAQRRERKRASLQNVFFAQSSHWIRAPHSGSFRCHKKLGDVLRVDDLIATITDPFGDRPESIHAKKDGLIIGMSSLPLVNRGDAMFHIAYFDDFDEIETAFDDEPGS